MKYLMILLVPFIFSCRNSKIKKEPKIINYTSSFLKKNGNGWKENSILNDQLNINFNYEFRRKLIKTPSIINDMPLEITGYDKINDSTYAVDLHSYRNYPGIEFNIDVIGVMDNFEFSSLNTKQNLLIDGKYLGDLNENNSTYLPHNTVYSLTRSISNEGSKTIVNTGVMVYKVTNKRDTSVSLN